MQFFLHGIPWEILRPNAMNLGSTFDSIVVNFDIQQQKDLRELIEAQKLSSDPYKKLPREYDDKKICNVPWKKLKHLVMKDDQDY